MHYKVIHQLKERNFNRDHTKSEVAVLDYLENHFFDIPDMTVIKLAAESYTSQATVNRTSKLLGFDGYSQLKYAISEDIQMMRKKEFSHVMDTEYLISKIDFESAISVVEQIKKYQQRLLIFGLGGSYISAQYLQRQLLYFGIPAVVVSELQMLHNFRNYTLIILSSSGETQRCLQLIKEAKRVGIQTLALTKKESSVANNVDFSFTHDVPVDKMKGVSREQQFHMIVMVLEIINQIQQTMVE